MLAPLAALLYAFWASGAAASSLLAQSAERAAAPTPVSSDSKPGALAAAPEPGGAATDKYTICSGEGANPGRYHFSVGKYFAAIIQVRGHLPVTNVL
jgi:hypothetical protein